MVLHLTNFTSRMAKLELTVSSVYSCSQSLVVGPDFQHILRILNTNIDGRRKCWIALTSIAGIGRRFAILICKKAEVDITKRYGFL